MKDHKHDLSAFFMPVLTKDDEEPKPEIFKCETCGRIAHISECPQYWDQESWEIPQPYLVVECPAKNKCDGAMEPYALTMTPFAIWKENAWINMFRAMPDWMDKFIFWHIVPNFCRVLDGFARCLDRLLEVPWIRKRVEAKRKELDESNDNV